MNIKRKYNPSGEGYGEHKYRSEVKEPESKFARLNGADNFLPNRSSTKKICTIRKRRNQSYGFNCTFTKEYPLVVDIIADSPAIIGGLKINDRILKINSIEVPWMTAEEFIDTIRKQGDFLDLFISRTDERLSGYEDVKNIDDSNFNAKLCVLRYNPNPANSGYGFCVLQDKENVLISEVQPHSPAESAGLTEGDLVLAVNGMSTVNMTQAQVCRLIKSNRFETELFVIDRKSYQYFQNMGIEVHQGMTAMRKFESPFYDLPKAKMCRLRLIPEFSGYGFDIWRLENTKGHVIRTVSSDSPAALGSVKADDRLIEINGINCENLDIESIVQLIKGHPQKVDMLLADKNAYEFLTSQEVVIDKNMSLVEEFLQTSLDYKKDDNKNYKAHLCVIRKDLAYDGYGFHISCLNQTDSHCISQVASDSPAGRAGIGMSDRIIEVNGIKIHKLSLDDVTKLIKEFPSFVELLLVDEESYEYFKKNKIEISSSMQQLVQSDSKNKPVGPAKILPLLNEVSAVKENKTIKSLMSAGAIRPLINDAVIPPLVEKSNGVRPLLLNEITSLLENDAIIPLMSLGSMLQNGSSRHESNLSGKQNVYRCNVFKRANYIGYGFTVQQSIDGRKAYIEKVLENSPADLDGLKNLSTILEINGQSVIGLDLPEIISIVKTSDDRVSLVLEDPENITQNGSSLHDGDVSEITLKSSYAGYGFSLKISNDNAQVIISSVVPNSPADLSGILPSDVLLKVNGYKLNNMSFNEIITLVKKYDDEVKLLIKKSTIIENGEHSQDILPQDFIEVTVPKNRDGYGFTVKPNLDGSGVYIYQVMTDTPANRCGLKSMDIVMKVNGKDVQHSSFEEVISLIKMYDERVHLTITRAPQHLLMDFNDEVHNIHSLHKHVHEVAIRKLPSQPSYGFTLHPHKDTGVFYISSIAAKSPAEISGLRTHDLVIEINGYNIDGFSIMEVIELVQMYAEQVMLIVADPPPDVNYGVEPVFFEAGSIYDQLYPTYCGFHKCTISKNINHSGFGFTLNEIPNNVDAVLVTSVHPESPAEKHGLQEFEHVLEVNGRRLREMAFIQVIELIKTQTHQITLVLGQPLPQTVLGGQHGFLRDILPDFIAEAKIKPISSFVLDIIDKIFALEYEEFQLSGEVDLKKALMRGNYILAKGYSNDELTKKTSTDLVDFNVHEIRIAYVLRFFVTHAYAITDHMANAAGTIKMPGGRKVKINMKPMVSWVQRIKMQKCIRIVCFGGGPGSDVLGVIDFLNECPINCRIQLTMFDKFLYWESTISKMVAILAQSGKVIDFKFVVVDFLVPADIMNVINYVRDADIITMSKFVSAIQAYDKETRYGLSLVFYNMAPGSLIFFLDNSGGGSYQMFNSIADACDLHQIYSFIDTYTLPGGAINHFRKYKQNYDIQPSKMLAIAVAMFLKPDIQSMSDIRRKYF